MTYQRGFTLIEALVALAILAFGLMGIAAMQLNALNSATRGYQHSVATLAAVDAQERLWETLLTLPPADDCKDISLSSVRSSWQTHWGRNSPSNPLRSADLALQPITRLIHEAGPKTKIADGILLKIQCVPPRI